MKVNISQRKARIELLPLLDMIFLVLVCFIYSFISMTVQRGIPVRLPYAQTSLADKKDFSIVSITENGDIFLDKTIVSINALIEQLTALRQNNQEIKVFLNSDKNVLYDKVLMVLDSIRKSGIEKVSLQTSEY